MQIIFIIQTVLKRKLRSFLTILSIILGIGSLLVFTGINNGIRNATFEEMKRQSPLTQITVRPPIEESGIVSFITRAEDNKLQQHHVEEISKIRGVKNVYPETQFNNFASLEVSVLGQTLITDAMIFGVPKGFIAEDIKTPKAWGSQEEPYPAIIPRNILNIYNIAVASPQNLPTLSEETLIGREITLYPNYSTFFPTKNGKITKIKLEIVGFSDKVNLVGATLPFEVVEKLNFEYAQVEESGILEIFVETTDATQTAQVAERIEEMGFDTFYFQKNIGEVEARFDYLRNSLGIISAIILLMSAITIMSTFLATISERTKQIGLFRSLGATKFYIKKMILVEAGILGGIGSIIGILAGTFIGIGVNTWGIKELEQTTFRAEKLFLITPSTTLWILIFGIFLCVISAYIPAHKASKTSPIDALNR